MNSSPKAHPLTQIPFLLATGKEQEACRAFRSLSGLLRNPAHWNSYFQAAVSNAPEISHHHPGLALKTLHAAEGCITSEDERLKLRSVALTAATTVQLGHVGVGINLYHLAGRLSHNLTEKQEVTSDVLAGAEIACQSHFFAVAIKLGNFGLQKAITSGQRTEAADCFRSLEKKMQGTGNEWHRKRMLSLARLAQPN